ncbi:MAG: hypothetical protein EA378_08845 [Phycisphaerales bacterium]|nr:MAG: hypothetical protein EA378_08845 [Phycisphaerales bacterium]
MSFPMKLLLFTALGLALLIALIVALYIVSAARLSSGTVNIARNYAAEINEQYTKPDAEDPAWPHYLDAFAYIIDRDSPARLVYELDLTPDQPAAATFREWLAENPGYREALLTGASRPATGFRISDAENPLYAERFGRYVDKEPSENPILINTLLPQLGMMRDFTRTLRAHAALAIADGRPDIFLEDVRAMLAIAEHSAQPPMVISQIVRYAMISHVHDTVCRAIHRSPEHFDDASLNELARLLDRIDLDSLTPSLTVERMSFEDILQRAFTDDGQGDGRITAEGIELISTVMFDMNPGVLEKQMMPLVAGFYPSRAEALARFNMFADAIEKRASQPVHERAHDPTIDDIEVESRLFGMLEIDLAIMFLPSFNRMLVMGEHSKQMVIATRAAVALERFRRDHVHYPATLDELVPDFLDTLPIDRATGGPLVYRLDNNTPILYSVGLNYTDNGGDHNHLSWMRWLPPEELARRLQLDPVPDNLPTGDWVYYPPPPPPSRGN